MLSWFLSPRNIIYGVADDVGGGFDADFGCVDYEVVVGRVLPFFAGVMGVVALAGFVFEADYFAGLFFCEVVLVADEGYGIIFVAADEDVEAVWATAQYEVGATPYDDAGFLGGVADYL